MLLKFHVVLELLLLLLCIGLSFDYGGVVGLAFLFFFRSQVFNEIVQRPTGNVADVAEESDIVKFLVLLGEGLHDARGTQELHNRREHLSDSAAGT